MDTIMNIKLSDETARRFECVVKHIGASREDILREIFEFGLEDLEDAIAANAISKDITSGKSGTIRILEKDEELVPMGR